MGKEKVLLSSLLKFCNRKKGGKKKRGECSAYVREERGRRRTVM